MSNRMLVHLHNLTISIDQTNLFTGMGLSIHGGELVALLGPNGCGKSTILNQLTHRTGTGQTYDPPPGLDVTGSVSFGSELTVGYLPQSLADDRTISPCSISSETRQEVAETRICADFGLETIWGDDTLSEGMIQKRALARVLAGQPDLLVLDEPTNYLDLRGITALEHYLQMAKDRGAGILLVTHDRTLTDNLADRTVLITPGAVYSCAGGWSAAFEVRNRDVDSRRRQARDITKKLRRLQDDFTAKAGWATSKEKQKRGAGNEKAYIGKMAKKMAKRAAVVQQRVEKEKKRLEKTKPFVPKEIRLRFPSYEVKNRQAFSLADVSFSYDSASGADPLLTGVSLSASTRDKICLVGANGAGKSTLIKLALGMVEPQTGRSYQNPGVHRLYVEQGLTGFFPHPSLMDNFGSCGLDQARIRQYLGAAGIRQDKVSQPITSLSSGELMRVAIVKCLLMQAEFLILDEPTSHLDIESIEVLELLLRQFQGGFLLVSHDRSFVENVANTLYTIENGRVVLV